MSTAVSSVKQQKSQLLYVCVYLCISGWGTPMHTMPIFGYTPPPYSIFMSADPLHDCAVVWNGVLYAYDYEMPTRLS